MAMMALELHPAPSMELVMACLRHDVHERWLGDVPAPVKWNNADLRQALWALENRINDTMKLSVNLKSNEDRTWLKGLDALELFLFCQDELRMGNRNVQEVANTCHKLIFSPPTPKEIQAWAGKVHYRGRTTNKMGVD
jgi:5'-deoxynucleotidase YfbR-like HD superfamily hydrolase